jgi:hypothetical protein
MPFRFASHSLSFRARTALMAALTFASFAISGSLAFAQAAATGAALPPGPSRIDLYGGYGYINPGNSSLLGVTYQPIQNGAVFSAAAYFNTHFGVQAEGNFFPNGPNDCIHTAQAGPIFRYQKGRLVPFVHVLAGGAKVGGPIFQPCTWGWGATAGGGLDFILPALHNRIALRPIQADYDYSHVNYGPVDIGLVDGGIGVIHAYKLSAGVVVRFGEPSLGLPAQMGCTVEPANAFPGDPVTVTAAPANLRLNRKTTYTWTTTGGSIAGKEVASINTAALAPGDYTASGHVSQGIHPGQQASCSVGFRIHAFEPPTASCSAAPSVIMPGESTTITTTALSPQNRALTYSYIASSGQVIEPLPTTTLSSAGAPPGPIVVTCNVTDDLGQHASAETTVVISTPPPVVAPAPVGLCAVSFDRDKQRPVRVDNEGKGCLDEVALTLNRDSASKLVIVGRHTADETPDDAAERALNVEHYLVKEKGIDASRIDLRITGESGKIVDDILLPPGATFAPGDTTTFDATTIHHHGPV